MLCSINQKVTRLYFFHCVSDFWKKNLQQLYVFKKDVCFYVFLNLEILHFNMDGFFPH